MFQEIEQHLLYCLAFNNRALCCEKWL